MKMNYATRTKLYAFLDALRGKNAISPYQAEGIKLVARTPDPEREVLDEVDRGLWRGLRTRLGLTRNKAEKGSGVAAKLGNLLLALHGFAVLFTVAALAPVLFLYRRHVWLIPVLAIVPLWHLYAERVFARRLGDRAMADSSHIKACLFAIIPIFLLYGYLFAGRKVAPTPLIIPVAWLIHSTIIALVTRARGARILAMWLAGLLVNSLIIHEDWRPLPQTLLAGNSLVALALLLLSRPRKTGGDGDATGYRSLAGFFILYSLLLAAFAWFQVRPFPVAGGLSANAWQALLSVPAVAVYCRREAKSLAGTRERIHYQAGMIGIWLFFAFTQLGLDFSWRAERLHRLQFGGLDAFFAAWIYLIILSWSYWLYYGQTRDPENYHETTFELAGIGLIACLVAFLAVCGYFGLWYLALAAGTATFFISGRKLAELRKLPLEGETRSDPESPESP